MNVSKIRLTIILAAIIITYFLLQDVTGVVRTPIKQPLAAFPRTMDTWQVISGRESSEDVVRMLGVDDYVEYYYTNKEGEGVNFYAAYYEAVGGNVGYHSPKNCIPGGGWGIEAVGKVDILPQNSQKPVTVTVMTIRKGNEFQMVFYWFQNRGRIIHSEYWEKFYLVMDAIWKKRRDGTFVRLITRANGGNLPQAENVLKEFAALALAELDNFIPGDAS